MNILDENIPETQRGLLRSRHVTLRQIGQDVGWKGMKDDGIIPLLHQWDRPAFFTLDSDFYHRALCHKQHCLIYLDFEEEMVAEYVCRLLRHREFNTKAKRMGHVIRVSPTGLSFWQPSQEQEGHFTW